MTKTKKIGRPRTSGAYDTKLEKLLVKHGISPEKLAGEAGITVATVNHYRSGDNGPRLLIAGKIVRALNALISKDSKALQITDIFVF